MTPAVGWTERDYFLASRAARAAFDQTNSQLQIDGVLEEVEATRAGGVPTAATSISSSANGDSALAARGRKPGDGRPSRRTTPQPRAASACVDGSGPDVPPPGPSQDHALDIGAGHGGEPPGSIPGSSTPAEGQAVAASASDVLGVGSPHSEPSLSAGLSPTRGPGRPEPLSSRRDQGQGGHSK